LLSNTALTDLRSWLEDCSLFAKSDFVIVKIYTLSKNIIMGGEQNRMKFGDVVVLMFGILDGNG
jgi:hypothetical protein